MMRGDSFLLSYALLQHQTEKWQYLALLLPLYMFTYDGHLSRHPV